VGSKIIAKKIIYLQPRKEYIFSLSCGEDETGERLTCWRMRIIKVLLPSSYVAAKEGEFSKQLSDQTQPLPDYD